MQKTAPTLEDDETLGAWQDDAEDDESGDDAADDESDDEGDGDVEDEGDAPPPRPRRRRKEAPTEANDDDEPPPRPVRIITERAKNRPRTHNGMGRPPHLPPPRAEDDRVMDADVIDASDWPGTALAAKIVGRHQSTIKAWRTQGRLRAVQAADGTWRYHPEDLAELESAGDQSDPASVLATGMTAIVTQGATASDRLLAMTELATKGLETTIGLLSAELTRAYARITQLETERVTLLDRVSAGRAEEMKHERRMRLLDNQHALDLEGAKETSQRIRGLLELLGPIAKSLVEQISDPSTAAIAASPKAPLPATSAAPSAAATVNATDPASLGPFEAKIAEAMTRLCTAIRNLPPDAVERLSAVAGAATAADLKAVTTGRDAKEIGAALGSLTSTLRQLEPAVFRALASLCPPELAAVATELRTLLTVPQTPPE